MINAAYVDLLDKVGPSVVMVHSQAGQFGLMAAETRPDKVRALILLELAGLGDPAQVVKLKDIPILAVFGDFIEQDARWPKNPPERLRLLRQDSAPPAERWTSSISRKLAFAATRTC